MRALCVNVMAPIALLRETTNRSLVAGTRNQATAALCATNKMPLAHPPRPQMIGEVIKPDKTN